MKPSLFQIISILFIVEIMMFPSAAFSSSFSLQEINSTKIADDIANSPEGKDITKNTSVNLKKIIKEQIDKLKNKAGEDHTVPVIIGLKTNFIPEGKLSFSSVEFQKSKIKLDQDALVEFLSNNKLNKVHKFEHIPFISMTVDKKSLERLESSPLIATISEDILFKPTLTVSVPLVGATTAWGDGFSGQGQTIGILDTGVDKNHSFLSGKVVSEACYSSSVSDDPFTSKNEESFSVCPGGAAQITGPDTGLPCSINGCDHGTHVAGIAAGDDPSISGVAKDANIIAVQVFSRFTDVNPIAPGNQAGVQAYVSDIAKGLDQIATLSLMYDISSVNLSLGGGAYVSAAQCDADGDLLLIKQAVDNLRSYGIVTVASSGNDGSTSSMGAPACLSNIVSVGSSTKTDFVSSFSNTPNFLDLLAPGSSITSSIPGGGFISQSGTSMAAPHVAGAWAVLKSSDQSATIDEVLSALKNNGVPISRNSMTFPRIQVDAAINDLNCIAGWFNCNWEFRKQISIDSAKVSDDLTNFPVLVSITDANLASSSLLNGYDILFTSSDGTTKLSHEIEDWNKSTGELTAWVKVPFLSSTSDTSLYMYYGNPSAINQQDLTGGTWNSNYKMVQHMQENPALANPAIIDSTSNGNNLDAIGMESGDLVQAKIGKGLSFDSTIDEYLQKNPFNDISGTTITTSFWMRSSDTSTGTPVSYASSTAMNNEWLIFDYTNFRTWLKNTHLGYSGQSANDGTWHHIVVTRSGTQVNIFKDGINVFTSNSASPNAFTTGGCLVIAQEQDTVCGGFQSWQDFEGQMDELRISNVVLSNGWIATEYMNQNNPSSFVTVGNEDIS